MVLEILVLKDLGDLKVPSSYKAIALGASTEDIWAKPVSAVSQDVTVTGRPHQGFQRGVGWGVTIQVIPLSVLTSKRSPELLMQGWLWRSLCAGLGIRRPGSGPDWPPSRVTCSPGAR